MVHTLASLLTATAMLLHAVLGCCVHHDHAHQVLPADSCDSQAIAESHDHHRHTHHSHADDSHAHDSHTEKSSVVDCDGPSGCGDQHDPAEPCDEARCQWVGTETLAKVSSATGDELAAPVPALLSAGLLLSGHPVASLGPPGIPPDVGDSSRARARQQVWRL